MNVYIVYRENAYQGFEVEKIFSSSKSAKEYVLSQSQYDQSVLSIEEDFVYFDETS